MPVHALPASVRVHMLSPLSFNDAQEIGDRIKSGSSVFMDMRAVDRDLETRLRDFLNGLTSALGGAVTDVAHGIILVAPQGVSVSGEPRDEATNRANPSRPVYSYDAMDADVTPIFRSVSA
ncbi:MAG: cell division protein SepF [Thermoleophilia bacterium]|nr:cell division protein SepF [Thermoleophilia bacterium]